MTGVDTPFIDWREQRAALQRHLDGEGGVVRIEVEPAGLETGLDKYFYDALTTRLRDAHRITWAARDPRTHYVDDLFAELENRLDLEPPPPDRDVQISIARDAHIEGGATISHNTFNVAETSSQRARLRTRRAAAITEALRTHPQRGCLIISRSHDISTEDLRTFHNVLWRNRLESLCRSGFLLVEICRAGHRRDDLPEWPLCRTTCTLSHKYTDVARAAATDDLTDLIMGWQQKPEGEARAHAEHTVRLADLEPARVYGFLPRLTEKW